MEQNASPSCWNPQEDHLLALSKQQLASDLAMEDYIVNWVISGALFWSTTFLLVRSLFRNRSFDFCNRVVSTIHAVVAVSFASFSVQDWRCPACPLASRSSPLQAIEVNSRLRILLPDVRTQTKSPLFHWFLSDEGVGCDAVLFDLWYGMLPVRQKSKDGQLNPPRS